MRPILTPHEMREVDAAAVARGTAEEILIERAAWAVARRARRMLGGSYGRRVVVIAGPGNNGADGRVAARFLTERGVRVRVIDAASIPERLPECDLVIDAAYGTGFRGVWNAPRTDAPVLAVDFPSGVDGMTGCSHGRPLRATATVTFAALKPGLLFGDGAEFAGDVEIVDIGLDVSSSSVFAVDASDVSVPARAVDAHKWKAAVLAVAGSPGMIGAASLASEAALRAGAGIVHLVSPGSASDHSIPREVVRRPVAPIGWAPEVVEMAGNRFAAMVLGPGLGRDESTMTDVRRLVADATLPMVIDGDALFALGDEFSVLASRRGGSVITPHDGEFARLTGHAPSRDRIAAARSLAHDADCVCLLKGPATVIAAPDGRVAVVDEGDQRLATAGSGDVLAGVVAAFIARGAELFEAAYSAAFVHARAARHDRAIGLLAGDLPLAVADVLAGDFEVDA
ncbi:MAG: NAD(P)H-hydrate dehydratase [Acidimicrobiales bacterium mtb01]|nr:NAD(P)H-hydrate dehydratase [Actinomycetota bacterium]TEX47228.1 MAG: NAD(P)H-hydrate dehydratase [Acidimicrobiales bacterium mtb01]